MRIIFVSFFLIINTVVSSQPKELKAMEMESLLPERIEGFRSRDGVVNRRLKIGTLSYTLCERKYTKGKQSIKLLLFDFVNADIMYKQATHNLHEGDAIESDSLVLRPIILDNSTGWESYRRQSGQSQIVLGICHRFFLSMTGDKVDLAMLQSVLNLVPLEKYPKLESTYSEQSRKSN